MRIGMKPPLSLGACGPCQCRTPPKGTVLSGARQNAAAIESAMTHVVDITTTTIDTLNTTVFIISVIGRASDEDTTFIYAFGSEHIGDIAEIRVRNFLQMGGFGTVTPSQGPRERLV